MEDIDSYAPKDLLIVTTGSQVCLSGHPPVSVLDFFMGFSY